MNKLNYKKEILTELINKKYGGNNIEIKEISCGFDYTFILTNDGNLYSCGDNSAGQLGRYIDPTSLRKVKIYDNDDDENELKIQEIHCGSVHTFILTDSGKLYSCGSNNNGQLGREGDDTELMEVKIESGVKKIRCGGGHTFILTDSGKMYSCGRNDFGQLGRYGNQRELMEVKIDGEEESGVKEISCGGFYTFILTDSGKIYSCGNNDEGQLGKEGDNTKLSEVKIESKVKEISCGYYHTFILAFDGKIYSCGRNVEGQLGRNGLEWKFMEVKIDGEESGIKEIRCGGGHTFVLSNDGKLYSCGRNVEGQLGRYGLGWKFMEVKIDGEESGIKEISCGSLHTFVIANNGNLYSCGRNTHGQLGRNGDNEKFMEVELLPWDKNNLPKLIKKCNNISKAKTIFEYMDHL